MRLAEEVAKRGLYDDHDDEQLLALVRRHRPVPGLGGRGADAVSAAQPGGNWDRYQNTRGRFYSNAKAVAAYDAYICFLVPQAEVSPVVIWELANEPRGINNVGAYHKWIDTTARLIKTLAPASWSRPVARGRPRRPFYAGLNVGRGSREPEHRLHHLPHVGGELGLDPQGEPGEGLPEGARAREEVHERARDPAAKLGKPILLEEFGFPRDGGSFDPASAVTLRDQYFQEVYALVHALMPTTPMAGIMPWAWAGDAPAAAAGRVLEAGRSVHRGSAARGAGLVQRVRQGLDAEADHRVVAPDHRDGRDLVTPALRDPPRAVTVIKCTAARDGLIVDA